MSERPEPKFYVSPYNFGESITVECDLCAAIEEWREEPLEFLTLSKWVSEHRGAHFETWEQEQRDAGNVPPP